MALADRVSAPPENKHPGRECSVGWLLRELPADESAALAEMLGTPEQRSAWTAVAIYDALVAEGHSVGRQTISRHRARRCGCFR